jgi:hypothetical protein
MQSLCANLIIPELRVKLLTGAVNSALQWQELAGDAKEALQLLGIIGLMGSLLLHGGRRGHCWDGDAVYASACSGPSRNSISC